MLAPLLTMNDKRVTKVAGTVPNLSHLGFKLATTINARLAVVVGREGLEPPTKGL